MRRIKDIVAEKPWVGWAIFFATLIIVFFVGLFGSSIIERRTEATLRFQPVEKISPLEPPHQLLC